MVEDALRETFARRKQAKQRKPVKLPAFSGELRPGVSLDSYAALLDLMEEDER